MLYASGLRFWDINLCRIMHANIFLQLSVVFCRCFLLFFLRKCDITPFCSTRIAFVSVKLSMCMYSLPIKNKKMKGVCISFGLCHSRSHGWTVNALNSFNLQSVKGKSSNWFVVFKMLHLKSKHRACTTANYDFS